MLHVLELFVSCIKRADALKNIEMLFNFFFKVDDFLNIFFLSYVKWFLDFKCLKKHCTYLRMASKRCEIMFLNLYILFSSKSLSK